MGFGDACLSLASFCRYKEIGALTFGSVPDGLEDVTLLSPSQAYTQ